MDGTIFKNDLGLVMSSALINIHAFNRAVLIHLVDFPYSIQTCTLKQASIIIWGSNSLIVCDVDVARTKSAHLSKWLPL